MSHETNVLVAKDLHNDRLIANNGIISNETFIEHLFLGCNRQFYFAGRFMGPYCLREELLVQTSKAEICENSS